MALYAADGSFNVTVVDGTTLTGIYAADGSFNVYIVDGTTLTGLYHACGAYNVYISDGDIVSVVHPCGAMVMSQDPYVPGTVKATGLGTVIVLDTTDVPEDTEAAEVVFTASISGVSYTGTPAWSLGGADTAYFSIHAVTGVVTLDASLDYDDPDERTKNITITVADIDPLPATNPQAFVINVTNVIETPNNLTAPVVSGDLDGTLVCSTGEWDDMLAGSFTYQWYDASDDSELADETANTLEASGYAGLDVYCIVTATNTAGSDTAESNTVGPLVALVTLSALGISADLIEEGAAEDEVVGALTNTSGGSTLSLIDDAGGKFKLTGSNIVAGATPTTFPATEEITVRETLAGATNTPRDTVLEITVYEFGSVVPDAPILTWLGTGYEFEFVLDNPEDGDTLRYTVSDASDMSNIVDGPVDDVLSAGEITAGQQTPALDDELPDGTYYVTVEHSKNGVTFSDPSNIEEITVVSTSPRQYSLGRFSVNVATGARQYSLGRFSLNE
jgi:hypothetical protein